ncbi:MAG: alpha/beta hydrolase [Magnetovibrio sp.]|nr:alpha/beta hydrolase [Magnetovibrio sp.]
MDEAHPAPQILTRDDGATIAYHQTAGKHPGVVFLTGFKSDMTGGKAMELEAFCRERGQAFLRFDYFGHGQSSGEFEDGTIGRWADDAVFAIDGLTEGPQILVGSSMGGWIMLLAALARPDRIAGLVGIAAAPDFTEDLIPAALDDGQKRALERDGVVDIPNCYDDLEPYRIRKRFLDEGRDHLLLRGEIAINCPVRLIHGREDEDVPWETSHRLMERLASADVEVQLVKAGDHRLSEPHDLTRLRRTLGGLLDGLG